MSDDKTLRIPVETAAPTAALPVTANEDATASTTVLPEAQTETLPAYMESDEPTVPLYRNAAQEPRQDRSGSNDRHDSGDSDNSGNPVDANQPNDSNDAQGNPHMPTSTVPPNGGGMRNTRDASPRKSGKWRANGTDDDLVIRPTGPSVPTIILGALLCIVGVAVLFSGMSTPWNWLWQWAGNPRLLVVCTIGGFGVFLIAVAVVWALAITLRNRHMRRDEMAQTPMERSDEQSPERQ